MTQNWRRPTHNTAGSVAGLRAMVLPRAGMVLCGLLAICGCLQGPVLAQVKTRLLTADEIAATHKAVNPGLVEGIAGPVDVAVAQSFAVEGEGFAPFKLEPARYLSKNESGSTSYRCGVFVVPAKGAATFLPTIGYSWTEAVQCESLEGVSFLAGVGHLPPQVLLLYAASSPNAEVKEPVVLGWSATTGRYRGDEALSRRLENDETAFSIVGMKRAIRKAQAASGPKS